MKRSRLSAVLITLAVVLAACGTNKSSPNGGVAGASGGPAGGAASGQPIGSGAATGNLTVWAMGAEGDKLGQVAKEFEAKNPGVKVSVTSVGWDQAHDKILTAIAGHQEPDVSLVGTTWMGEFSRTGALDAVPSSIDSSQFYSGAWASNVVNGTAYGVPWYIDTRLLFYRSDMAQKAGITSPPATWTDLTNLAKALQQKGGAKWGISLQPGQTGAWQSYIPFVWSNGGDILSADGKSFALNSPQAVEALTYWQSFFKDGLAPKTSQTGFDVVPVFVQGQFASFISGSWQIASIKTAGGDSFSSKYSLAMMPKKQSATSFLGGGNFVVFKDTKNRDAAWKFVQYMSQPDVQAKWFSLVGDLPAVKSAWQQPQLANDKNLQLFGQQANDAKGPPPLPHWEQIAAAIDDELAKVASAGEDPKAAADNMQQKATSIGMQ